MTVENWFNLTAHWDLVEEGLEAPKTTQDYIDNITMAIGNTS